MLEDAFDVEVKVPARHSGMLRTGPEEARSCPEDWAPCFGLAGGLMRPQGSARLPYRAKRVNVVAMRGVTMFSAL